VRLELFQGLESTVEQSKVFWARTVSGISSGNTYSVRSAPGTAVQLENPAYFMAFCSMMQTELGDDR